jgi:hypothetical protein
VSTSNGTDTPSDRDEAVRLLAEHWPAPNNGRQSAALALAGGLLRAGLTVEDVEALVERVCEQAGDEEADKRVGVVRDTAVRLAAGDPVVGWPRLAELLDNGDVAVAERVRRLLAPGDGPRIVATYDYQDEAGVLRYQVVRFAPKVFRQRRPDGNGGWHWNMQSVQRLPYRLPELLAADPAAPVFIPEGEKDVENLRALNLVATTNPMGAGKWRPEYNGPLRGRHVVVLADHDEPGGRHVRQVADSLVGTAASVKVLELPGLPPGGDVSDWLAAGGTAGELLRLAAEAPAYESQTPGAAPGQGNRYRPLPPFRPFPVGALPSPLDGFITQTAAALGCDPAYVALPVLAAVFAVIGNTRRVRLKRSWLEPAVGWFAIVGESGTLKSPAQEAALGPLERVEARLAAERREQLQQYQMDQEEYQELRKKARKEGKELPTEPERPPERRVLVHDVTIERLAELLEDNPRGLLLSREELDGWLGSFSRYRSKSALESSDLPYWLSIHGARALRVDRKGGDRRTVYVPRAAVTVVGGIQPGTLTRCLTTPYFEAGLVARLLLAMPPTRRKRWSEAEVHPDVTAEYEGLLQRLLALDFDQGEDGPVPFTLRLSPGAKERWVQFYIAWAGEQAAAEGELCAALSKLEGYCARFALVHHVVARVARQADDADPIEAASVEAAVVLTKWFADEARRIYMVLRESEEARQTRKLIEFILAHGGGITAKQLQRANGRRWPTSEAATAALQGLVDAGLADWHEAPPGPRGGRPTKICVLRPIASDETDETDETIPHEDLDTAGEAGGFSRPSDETSDETPEDPEKPREKQGFVGFVGSRTTSGAPDEPGANLGPLSPEVSSDRVSDETPTKPDETRRNLRRPPGNAPRGPLRAKKR